MSSDFKPSLYDSRITYVNNNSIFAFLDFQENVKEFFKYFSKSLKKKQQEGYDFIIENDNDRMALIDINYNFFIEKLGDWCQHYSANKTVVTEYSKYKIWKKENQDGEKIPTNVRADFKIELSVKERVQQAYSYSGWMIANKYLKRARFVFVQTFLNGFFGKATYVKYYSKPNFAVPVSVILVKNSEKNIYFKAPTISFHREFLKDKMGKASFEFLKAESKKNIPICVGSEQIKKAILKNNIDENDVKFYENFDIGQIENERNELSGEFGLFEKKIDENEL